MRRGNELNGAFSHSQARTIVPRLVDAIETRISSGVAIATVSPSACEPHRAFITEQLRLRRNYTSIYQDLVDRFGFAASYNSVKRFADTLVAKEPERFDRLEFAPGEEVQVDYGEGALTRVPGTGRFRRSTALRDDPALLPS